MNAGFWIRLKATWIDTLVIVILMDMIVAMLTPLELYIPYELSSIIAGIGYAVITTGLSGHTIGKLLCGLTVVQIDGRKAGFFTILIRESLAKLISFVFFFIGFIWIGLSRSKRAWHDYICRTKVVRVKQFMPARALTLVIPLLITLFLLRGFVADIITLYPEAIAFKQHAIKLPDYLERKANPIEVSSVTPEQDSVFVDWLNKHALSSEELLVKVAKEHQVTLLGELHNQRDNLTFVNHVIPTLYYKAGVRCIGIECIPHEMNQKVKQLVTAEKFDEALALDIARAQGWGLWGDKEYWDILRTVWQLNQSLPADKMEIVGIDSKYDMPSIALLGVGDAPLESPWWEKLRVVRAPINLLKIEILRDEIMAANIDKEIIHRNKKAVVLAGAEHAHIRYAPMRVGRFFYRMGYLLHAKYGDKLAEITLHRMYFPADEDWSRPQLGKFIDRIMKEKGNQPAGFIIKGSPFADLRDSTVLEFSLQSNVCLLDISDGYIFLNPNGKHGGTHWTEGYVSKKMFVDNKPFYECFWQKKLAEGADKEKWKGKKIRFRNSREVNDFIGSIWTSN